MKTRLNSSVVAAATLLACGAASAAPIIPGSEPAGHRIYLSGATASAQFVRNALADKVCQSSAALEISYYENDPDDWTLLCDVNPAIITGGGVYMFVKQGGGSGDGTTPVVRTNQSLLFPEITSGVPAACAAPVATATGAGTPLLAYTGCAVPNVTKVGNPWVSDIGASDVEPQAFKADNTPSTGIAWDPSTDSANVKPLSGLVFGVVATTSLRNALQAIQFPETLDLNGVQVNNPCYPGTPEHKLLMPQTINDQLFDVGRVALGATNPTADVSPSLGVATVGDSAECMPALSMAQIAGMVTSGGVTHWSQTTEALGTYADLIAAATQSNAVAAIKAGTVITIPTTSANQVLDNRRVHICRRNPGSGTQAQFNSVFLNRPCDIQSQPMLTSANSACLFTGLSVVCSNRGSSDVDNCMDDLEKATNTSLLFNGTVGSPTGPRQAWAIGLQSTEKNQALNKGYRFVQVQNAPPTVEASWNTDYVDYVEATLQKRSDGTSTSVTGLPDSAILAVFNEISNPSVVDIFNENQNFLHAFGHGGWLHAPDADGRNNTSSGPEAPLLESLVMDPNTPNPTAAYTRSGNSCQPLRVVDRWAGLWVKAHIMVRWPW